jgi:hypothetical protein
MRIHLALCVAALAAACSSSSGSNGPVGGPVTAPAGWVDTHCQDSGGGVIVQPVGTCDVLASIAPTNCSPPAAAAVDGGGAGSGGDGGTADGGGGADGATAAQFGDPLYGSDGLDDDCKYHVSWSSTPIRRNSDVTFTVNATRLADPSTAVSCADMVVDVVLPPAHVAPNTHPVATESAGGMYKIGPVRFDMPGMWYVRFHFYEYCADSTEDAPHGHVAFYISVP